MRKGRVIFCARAIVLRLQIIGVHITHITFQLFCKVRPEINISHLVFIYTLFQVLKLSSKMNLKISAFHRLSGYHYMSLSFLKVFSKIWSWSRQCNVCSAHRLHSSCGQLHVIVRLHPGFLMHMALKIVLSTGNKWTLEYHLT